MRHIFAILLLLALAAPVCAAEGAPTFPARGGFQGPVTGAQAETVDKAMGLPDDAAVILTGSIMSQVAGTKDKYNFRDSTGEIVVEIKRKVFQNQTITPNDKVRIAGKVDKDFGEPLEIDVKVLEVVK